jgi:hypothetical protein
MASLLIPSPAMALSIPLPQPQSLLGAQSGTAPATTQDTDSKLQSTIGSVTGEGGQTEKKENTQDRANQAGTDATSGGPGSILSLSPLPATTAHQWSS